MTDSSKSMPSATFHDTDYSDLHPVARKVLDFNAPALFASLHCGVPEALHRQMLLRGERSAFAREMIRLVDEGYFEQKDLDEFVARTGKNNIEELFNDKCEKYWRDIWKAAAHQITDLQNNLCAAASVKGTAAAFTPAIANFGGRADDTLISQISESEMSDTALKELGSLLADMGKVAQEQIEAESKQAEEAAKQAEAKETQPEE